MIVFGCDPSLTMSGCATVAWHPGTDFPGPAWQTWRARAAAPEISSLEAERRRVRSMLREILALVPARVDLSVIEGPAIGAKVRGKAEERAWLRGMLVDQLFARGPVVLVDPQRRAVLASGSGVRPRKSESVREAKARVLEAVRLLAPGAHVPDHNVADAVGLAVAGAHAFGMPVVYSAVQISAHSKVAWPGEGGPLVLARKG